MAAYCGYDTHIDNKTNLKIFSNFNRTYFLSCKMDCVYYSFEDKIIYQRYDGDTLYVITTDQDVKDRLDTWYSTSGITNIKFVITVDDKLPISELTKPIESLHGAKMVYVNENVDAFERDSAFATTGSLMMANGDSMVVITCQHALKKKTMYIP